LRKGGRLTLEETLAEINERDRRDSERADSPLVRADDAVYLDTSGKTIEEVLQDIVTLVETRQKEDAAKDE
jgi:cytidylate kinase